MSEDHPEKPSSPSPEPDTNPSVSPVDNAKFARRIEHLAEELATTPIPARLDSKMLAQLDELRTLMREQRKELHQQVTDADEMLKQCHDELARTDRRGRAQLPQQGKFGQERNHGDRRKRAG